ncbi:hypothetical protein D915_004215 [Fasciola hepatica]|uniref:Rab3 GTPase-activating protein non-catalytic subunit n=1 Tax=Fasciola hepatica TaxID=6192 RepID=A0A4E0RC43_FASHE|nr:hypothetical protein D915_004215 [Fasciola hepatica]
MTFNRMGKTAPSLPSLLLAEAKRMIFGSRSARSDKHILRIRYGLDGKNSSIPTASVQKPPSVQLDLSRALTDQHRECCPTGLVISADRQWLAVTDNLGRVLLVDAQRERVVRIWKGYRDAELAFYELTDRSGSTTRDTRCLLIHAPHRRMLELFRLVHGPCLSTWDVDEPARLIPGCHQIIGDFYPTYGLDRLRGIYQVFLLDSRGVLYTLRLSTALCLAETDSEAALNYHEYQVLQACYACLEQLHILGPAAVSTQLLEHFARFKSATWFERAIRNMCLPTETFVDFIGDCITFLSERVSDPNVVQLREFRRLLAQLSKMHSVMLFYQSAASNIENLMHGESVQTDISELSSDTYAGAWFTDAESVADLLNWDVDDATRCLSVYAICSRILLPSSHMRLSKPVDVRTFRDCFKYTVDDNLLKSNPQNLADSVSVEICPDDSTSRFSKIGAVIFAPYLLMKQSFKDLIELISLNVLSPTILLYALTCYILHRDTFRRIPNLIRRVHQLYAFLLVRFFESDVTSSPPAPLDCSNRTEAIQSTEPLSGESASMHNSFWRMWQKLHDFVVTSSQLSSAYLLSLVFRSLLYQAWESVDRDASLVRGWIACAQQHTFDTANCTQGDFLGVSQPDALIEVHHSRGSTPPFVAQTDDNPSVSLKPVGRQPPRSLVSLSTLNTLIEQWHDTCTRLEDLFILGLLVQLPASELSRGEHEKDVVKEPQVFPITLRRALTCGRACLTELFSAWLVHWHLQPDELISFYQNMCKSADSCTTPSDCTELALSKPFDLVKTLFPLVYKRLPFTLELDVVVASVCWIHYQRWLNDAKSMIHLQHCIEFLRRLSSAGVTIAQGLCSLMWKGGIGRLFDHCFTAVCGTSQGRFTPAAVRSVKEQSIIVMRFFSVFSHALQKSEAVPVFSVEREWSGLANSYTFSGEDALHSRTRSDHQAEEPFSPSAEWIARSVSHSDFMINLSHSLIAEVAVNCHPVPDRKLVALWEQSAIVVAALSTFSLLRKRSRPSRAGTEFYSIQDFFPISDARSLFANTVPDWATQPISFESDSGLDNRRRLFITWLIDRAVRSYGKSSDAHLVDRSSRSVSPSEDFPKPTSSMPHQNPGRHASSALDVYAMFTSSATTLARHWGLPRDTVLVQHVVALFEANLDDQAELYLSQVEDTGSLATRLLIVVGRRVSWYCFGAHNPEIVSYQLRWRACVPFDLESWLRGLQPENVSNSFREITNDLEFATEFNRLICLIDYIMDRIPSHASQIHMAESLRDAIYAMHEID